MTLSRRELLGTAAALALAGCSKAAGNEVLELGAQAAAARIATGEMKAEDYAGRLLEHYAAHKDLNAVVTIDADRVREEARRVDRARADGAKLGPLAGVPLAIKDQIDVAGYPTTAGNGALKPYARSRNAAIVDIVLGAGAVVFAKSMLPDMVGSGGLSSASATTDNRWFGAAHNPYDLMRTPGGSSGGNGALLAARIVPAAIGEDTGGSVRCPSAFCGTAGLRPSTFTVANMRNHTMRKRYPDDGIVPPPGLLETFGPMARTVADVAFLDAVITGEATPAAPDLRGVRIGIPRGDYWEITAMDPAVAKITQEAFAKLHDAGAALVEFDLNAILMLNENGRLSAGPPRESLEEWLDENVAGVGIESIMSRRIVPAGAAPPPPNLSDAQRLDIYEASLRTYEGLFRSHGIVAIAFPTIPFTAPFINLNGDVPGQQIPVNGHWIDEIRGITTNLFAGPRFGAPGLSLPSGMSKGLPVGLELDALPGDDGKLLALGVAVEKVLGHIPPPPFLQRTI
jgi:mandelamide amidase